MRRWTLCTVDDIPDGSFADLPIGCANHPAWVLGHLTGGMDNITRHLGEHASRDDAWAAAYDTGSTPTTDRDAYPGKSALIDAFTDAGRSVADAVRRVGEAGLSGPASEAVRAFFPTTNQWVLHVLIAEHAFHTGQLSVWRRGMGLPSVFEVEGNIERLMGRR
jgi:uncharacterized damage-inducible protein DinB